MWEQQHAGPVGQTGGVRRKEGGEEEESVWLSACKRVCVCMCVCESDRDSVQVQDSEPGEREREREMLGEDEE